ncbi:TlyA family RNA methyltransferase [Candidatus Sumerlaeota bacterium]|nr:TlyA family RNA methyltransferase [Candidatus Sumerlaeota bacterium]MBI3737289.1 TlyA family RNA methyltransferase [Candidatus Sumerlaeota bacterium]
MRTRMKLRLDQLVVERGLASGRDEAKRLILAGKVRVDGQPADKPGKTYDPAAKIERIGPKNPYVSRGGLKLAAALDRFGLADLTGRTALDIGASTGGFTDCLLKHAVSAVTAVDTGRGKIHERLRRDPRVRLMENKNARNLTGNELQGDAPELITIDVSFISLKLILPVCVGLLAPGGDLVSLVKPQFEAGKGKVGRGGIVRDRAIHLEVLDEMIQFCRSTGWQVMGVMASPILGSDGNAEFFLHLRRDFGSIETPHIDVEAAVLEAYNLQHA